MEFLEYSFDFEVAYISEFKLRQIVFLHPKDL